MLRSRRDVSTTSTSTRQEPSLLDADTKKGQKKKSTVNNLTSVFFGAMLLLSFLLFLMGHGANVHTDKSVGSGLRSSSSSSGHAARKSLFSDTTNQAKSVKDKKGKVMHHAITSVKQNDLAGLVDDELPSDGSPITFEQAIKGRERIVAILNDAGVSDMDPETILKLPKWSSVTKLYGEGPVVYGMETCAKFRETAALDDASIGTAGIFNTGTNPFAMYVEANCVMSHNTHDKHGGMRWQVPWGKHMLAKRKWTNTASHDGKVNKTNVLPVILVRDPYSWMQSMCKHPYAAKWTHAKTHCPNLVPNADDMASFPLQTNSVPVTVRFNPPESFDSLAHLWSEWYREYFEADYPRLMVRFEDLQFNVKEMIDLVCQCAGAEPRNDGKFTYVVDSGKWGPGHKGNQTNLISAMIKYGTDKKRFSGMTKEDLIYASEHLDLELMQVFQYEMPSL